VVGQVGWFEGSKTEVAGPRSQSGARRSDSVRHLLVCVHEGAVQCLPVRHRCCQIQLSRSYGVISAAGGALLALDHDLYRVNLDCVWYRVAMKGNSAGKCITRSE
jgi:hypothetical protein